MIIRELDKNDYYMGYLELLSQLTDCPNVSYFEFCRQLLRMMNNKYHKIFVIEEKNKIIGSITCIIELKIIHGLKNVGHIEDLVIDKNERGNDFGGKLIDLCINFCENNNCYKIILDCNDKYKKYYEKKGFVNENIQMCLRLI